jgi:hypothetical protein
MTGLIASAGYFTFAVAAGVRKSENSSLPEEFSQQATAKVAGSERIEKGCRFCCLA